METIVSNGSEFQILHVPFPSLPPPLPLEQKPSYHSQNPFKLSFFESLYKIESLDTTLVFMETIG